MQSVEKHNSVVMRHLLKIHPDSRGAAAIDIEVHAARPQPGSLALRYIVTGNVSDLRMPPVAAQTRADGLWRHTCFEAFVRVSPGAAYYEFNFAPSMQWAAYRFSGYRSGRSDVSDVRPPHLEARATAASYELLASLETAEMSDLPSDVPWQLALSAVIEETSGRKSYWALAHPSGQPDFHHRDCFALDLPAA
jgi:hypothetical protein